VAASCGVYGAVTWRCGVGSVLTHVCTVAKATLRHTKRRRIPNLCNNCRSLVPTAPLRLARFGARARCDKNKAHAVATAYRRNATAAYTRAMAGAAFLTFTGVAPRASWRCSYYLVNTPARVQTPLCQLDARIHRSCTRGRPDLRHLTRARYWSVNGRRELSLSVYLSEKTPGMV